MSSSDWLELWLMNDMIDERSAIRVFLVELALDFHLISSKLICVNETLRFTNAIEDLTRMDPAENILFLQDTNTIEDYNLQGSSVVSVLPRLVVLVLLSPVVLSPVAPSPVVSALPSPVVSALPNLVVSSLQV